MKRQDRVNLDTPEAYERTFLQAAEHLVGHKVELVGRQYGKAKHWGVTCSCGYESPPGRSLLFAGRAGFGHLKRVSDRLVEGRFPLRSTSGDTLAQRGVPPIVGPVL